jgi:hypothetical protein
MAGLIGKRQVTVTAASDKLTVTGDVNFDGMLNNDDSIDADVTIASGRNAMVIGPVTINATITVNGTFTVV